MNIYHSSVFKDDVVRPLQPLTHSKKRTTSSTGHHPTQHKIQPSITKQVGWLVMSQKYCTEIGSLFQVRNPAVTTHFFSFKELQLLEKRVFLRESTNATDSPNSPVWNHCYESHNLERPNCTSLLAKKCVVSHFTPLTSIIVKIPKTK